MNGRHADPLRALAAHLGQSPVMLPTRASGHEHTMRVAADAGADQRALGHLGGAVVRAAGAEERRALATSGSTVRTAPGRRRAAARRRRAGPTSCASEPRASGRGDQVGVEVRLGRQQRRAVARRACRGRAGAPAPP